MNDRMGKRGEWWVVLQGILLFAVALAPRVGWFALPPELMWLGFLLMAAGGIFGAAGALHLGENLTVFPKPRENGRLVTSGTYALARHPIYSGLVLAAFGWALWNLNPLGLLLAAALGIFFDAKSRHEERWLAEKYPEYAEYRKRVRKLIPFVY